ncbi:hypothetical protein HYDPIDRAFT_122657 [Hydnomerulius pinastri MD-312]|nr:hypothetical protein HYDPIDRAFT_122657 [Hydnomerulius pinastri MD-312]
MDSMYPNAPNQWPQNVTDTQHVHVDGRQTSNDDWKGRATPNGGAGAGVSGTAQSTLDLSDFGLGDIPGPSTSNSISPPPQSYYAHPYQSYYVSAVPGPYNAMAYGTMSWANQPTPLPLSSYSTLNGATTTSLPTSQGSTSQQQTSPQSPALSQPQMMIDPALTTMSSSETNRQYPPPTNHVARQTLLQSLAQPPQSQYQYQPPTLSINPSYGLLPSHFYSQSPQHQQSQAPATLSPHVLHSPSTSMMGSLSSFYSPSTTSNSTTTTTIPPANPQALKDKFSADIRPLLQPKSFTGAGAVNSLVGHIDDFGSQDVDATLRLEILTKIRDNAGNHYFRAWLENAAAMDITREWLKAGLSAKSDNLLVESVMPLLHIIDRLPMSVDALKASKLGKIIVKLVKEPPAPAIKDMASNLERKWRQMVESATKQGESNSTEDTKLKKRKLSDPPAKAPPPAKKAAVAPASASSSKVTVKKEARSVTVPVKDSRSDSSFFSAPKPKPKLPSFKKAPVTVKKESDTNVAQPSSIDPFQEALKSMGRGRKESPAVSTPPSAPAASTPPAPSTFTGKKRKSVTWAPDGQLESIRLIERAVYDDDPVDGIHTAHSLRDLDRGEGAALHAHLFEELIDWTDPITIDIPIDIDLAQRGQSSSEKTAQEEREQTALGALYMTSAQIPESPGEPSATIPEEEVDMDVKLMTVGPESDHFFWSESGGLQTPQVSVADLVNQLTAGGMDHVMDGPSNGSGLSLGFDPSILSSIPPEQMQQLMQQAQALFNNQGQTGGVQPPYGGTDQSWNSNPYFDSGEEYAGDDAGARGRWSADRGRGRGGRGRGRGRGDEGSYRSSKRKPCSFFAEGRCRYGDQCDFSHEPIY